LKSDADRNRRYASELVALAPDVIVATGSLTVAVSRDGVAVAAFGSCTNAKVE